jgi:FkbM family methyltransferase
MSLSLYLKHLLVRTPLEAPAKMLRSIAQIPGQLRHRELRELHLEARRIDRAIARILQPDSNCVDVGCHIGSTLSLMMKLAPLGRHWAFEPIPEKAEWLRRKFPDVAVRQIALSNESGSTVFHENVTRSGFSGFSRQARPGDRVAEHVVSREKLDEVIPSSHRVDFVKLDAEGCELLVLEGGAETLRRHRPTLLFECAPKGPQRFGREPRDLYEYVTDALRYAVYTPGAFLGGGGPLTGEQFLSALEYPYTAFNFIARCPGGNPGADRG